MAGVAPCISYYNIGNLGFPSVHNKNWRRWRESNPLRRSFGDCRSTIELHRRNGGLDEFRTRYLRRDRPTLSRLSYKSINLLIRPRKLHSQSQWEFAPHDTAQAIPSNLPSFIPSYFGVEY